MTQLSKSQVGFVCATTEKRLLSADSKITQKCSELFLLLTVAILVVLMAQPAEARRLNGPKSNPKYAAIVMDADTGTVLHEAYSDAIRHPASLTKMMTLYMTFDALKRGELNLSTRLRVSKRAASMPATNLFTKEGDRLTVDTAIKALVVRSANDIAVVLAEKLAGTEWKFSVAMTNQARKLGMTKTVFKNASGLPDHNQITTAREMAILGMALRRDFPQYYNYFNTTKFDYNGRTFKTHNHVLTSVQGVDGLKTGYINMSGFNLVTSIRRDGYSLVAVVMGGRTSRRRDDHMKSLLVRSLRQIASIREPFAPGKAVLARANDGKVPKPVFKPGTENSYINVASAISGVGDVSSDGTVMANQNYAPAAGTRNPIGKAWGIQVGAFSESRDAFMAAVHAMNVASRELQGSEISVADPDDSGNRVFRARIANLSEVQARRACRVLIARNESCFVYQQ